MDEETKACGKAKEDSFWSMVKDFYNMKMLPFIIILWSFAIIIIAIAIWSAVKFFKTEDVKSLIMYAVIFIVVMTWTNAIKIFAWQLIHRNGLMRQIKKIQTQLTELSEKIKEN